MRRTTLIIIILVLLALLGGGLYWYLHKQALIQQDGSMTPEDTSQYFTTSTLPIATPADPTGDRIGIQTDKGIVYVNNFYPTAEDKNGEYVVLESNDTFDILYFREHSSFLISINAQPVKDVRLAGEKSLMTRLGVSPRDACKLNISSGVPEYVDENLAGTSYGLSFCADQALKPL